MLVCANPFGDARMTKKTPARSSSFHAFVVVVGDGEKGWRVIKVGVCRGRRALAKMWTNETRRVSTWTRAKSLARDTNWERWAPGMLPAPTACTRDRTSSEGGGR
jgi:hypothetical protein